MTDRSFSLIVSPDDGTSPWTVVLDAYDVIKIGRTESAHVVLPDASVDRMHAVIDKTEEGPVLIDLGSTTGTYVNDDDVNKTTLSAGDTIRIGAYTLRVSFSAVGEVWEAAVEKDVCPRCLHALVHQRATSESGYRGGISFEFARCEPCKVSVLSADTIAKRYDRSDGRLSGTMLERERRGCEQRCPGCLGELMRLTLTWGTLWVELEECAKCGSIVIDDGEGAILDRMLIESKT